MVSCVIPSWTNHSSLSYPLLLVPSPSCDTTLSFPLPFRFNSWLTVMTPLDLPWRKYSQLDPSECTSVFWSGKSIFLGELTERTQINWSWFIFSLFWVSVHFRLRTLLWTVLLLSTRLWSNPMIRNPRCLSGPGVPPTYSPSPSASLLISQERSTVSQTFLYRSVKHTSRIMFILEFILKIQF